MPTYIRRLIVVFVLVVVSILSVRSLLVPPTFGQYGHYRGAALAEIASQTPLYAGREKCVACHQDVVTLKNKGPHAGLPCEVCHGPSAAHVRQPKSFRPFMDLDRSFCLHCHDQSLSRPSGFPMVDGMTHNRAEDCQKCHAPHNPGLTPQ